MGDVKAMQVRVGIIGHFGGSESFCDGQTTKTKNLYNLFECRQNIKLCKVDTYYAKTNKVKLLMDTVVCMLTCRYVFLLVSVNGMKLYLPLLYYLNKMTKKHIYHYVIGSELLELVAKNKKLVKYLNAFDANWFEYGSGTQYLREMGVKNVTTLPNFKMITPVKEASAYVPTDGVYRFCTFSRVMEEKGISEAINTIRKINTDGITACLDIYGPIDQGYAEEFEHLLKMNSAYVTYKGITDSAKSVGVLKNYYALLFPTRWAGEGFPGTIIDAFASGIPVIASDWNANKELIQNMKQGIIYPADRFRTLEDAISWSLENPDAMMRMRVGSRAEFENYTPDAIWNCIAAQMQLADGSCVIS